MTPIERGDRAQKLLDDPTLNDAFKNVEKAIHDAWSACPIRDHEGQHELRLMLKLLSDVRADLELAVSNGKMAAAELRMQEERRPVPLNEWRATYR